MGCKGENIGSPSVKSQGENGEARTVRRKKYGEGD